MTERVTPQLGDPRPDPNEPRWKSIEVTRKEVQAFMTKKKVKWTTKSDYKKKFDKYRSQLKQQKYKERLPIGRDVTVSQADVAFHFCYGKVRQGGVFRLIQNFANKRRLAHIITLAAHEITEVSELYIDGNKVNFSNPAPAYGMASGWTKPDGTVVNFSGNKVYLNTSNLGTTGQSAYTDAISDLPGIWTSNHKQSGRAHVYLVLFWDQELFGEEAPDFSFVMKGKKLYDPRTGLTTYSANAALAIADYLTNSEFGPGFSWSEIDTTSLSAAANICDENVPLKAGGTEKRYEVNGIFNSEQSHEEILESMELAMGGRAIFTAGKWKFFPGKYRTPSLTLTEADLRSDPLITTLASRSDVCNCVRGTFPSISNKFVETDYPSIVNTTYITADGGEKIWKDLSFGCVTSPTQAQRVARIALEQSRRPLRFVADFGLRALALEPGETVNLSMSRYGWSPQVFFVESMDLSLSPNMDFRVSLELQQTDSNVPAWNELVDEASMTIAPSTTLPDAFSVIPLSGLTLASGTSHLYVRQDGTVFSRIYASWTATTDPFVEQGGKIEIEYKKHADSVWQPLTTIGGDATSYYILDVEDGVSYDVRVRALNAFGIRSSYTTASNHTVVGKTAPPSSITDLSATLRPYGIELTWTGISDLDADQYEIRVGGANWAAAPLTIWRGRGESFVWEFKTAGTYLIRIKAIDTSGNYSSADDTASVVIAVPSAPVITSEVVGQNIRLTWTEPTSSDFAIKEYEVRYGADFSSGTTLAVITGLAYQTHIDWGGNRTFWVVARDVSSNESSAGSVTVGILDPNSVEDFTIRVADNNVLLDWDDPLTSTLPIHHYFVYKGDVFEAAVLLGTVYGTFHTYLENRGGTFKYWVVAVDTAGNESTPVERSTVVLEPTDFYIRDDTELVGDIVSSLHVAKGGSSVIPDGDVESIYLPLASTIKHILTPLLPFTAPVEQWVTWEQFFISHGFTTFQDAIDAGYLSYGTPSTNEPGFVTFKIDYGVTFNSSFIQFSWEEEILSGHVGFIPTIEYSTDDITYVTESGANQVFAENFRYVKYTISFTPVDDKALSRLFNIKAQISVKKDEEYGPIGVLASDFDPDPELDGTFIPFEKSFLDVQDIQITIITGEPGDSFVLNFDDVPNPTGFRILLFDINGDRIDGTINRRVIGAVNVIE